MKTNTLIKAGQVALLTIFFSGSNPLPVAAANLDLGTVNRGYAVSKKNIHHVSDIRAHGRASDGTRFNLIDGEPLDSLN
jgi:uncharacterized Fe-S radical SAM superfamily protein PflX